MGGRESAGQAAVVEVVDDTRWQQRSSPAIFFWPQTMVQIPGPTPQEKTSLNQVNKASRNNIKSYCLWQNRNNIEEFTNTNVVH